MKLFKFELKRFALSKRNIYLLAIISLLVVGYGVYQTAYGINNAQKYILISYRQGAESVVSGTNKSIKDLESVMATSQSPSEVNSLKVSIKKLKEDNDIAQQQVDALKVNDINKYSQLQEKNLKTMTKRATEKPGSVIPNPLTDPIIKNELAYYKAVQERHLDFEIMPSEQFHSFGNFQQQFLPMIK